MALWALVDFSGNAGFFRTKGPAIYLAQSKELKVPQVWVFAARYMEGPKVRPLIAGPLVLIVS